ncbi:hypothetical protein VB773_14140 [Haloarculaceae archaeon H-GB2-1]|nr:hypothetical protein [Haloarculaceae archaeon H-GB1-1]MEA5408595.1 hypothetical protein [Haloarculaceae archaeon H-GB2-1]
MAVISYRCPECGPVVSCDVNDIGERVCPECGRVVTAQVDGGESA